MDKFNSRCAGYRLRINGRAKTCFKQRAFTDDTRGPGSDRDEVIVCMVIAVRLGNAIISVIYRVLGH